MSLPRKSTRNGTRGYAHLVEIDVPVARVWRALTDPGLIRIWSGQEAEIDARKGGMYRLGKRNEDSREAHIDIFDVNRRLRLIYLSGSNWPPGESAVVDDFILDVRKGEGTTSLRLLGSGVPESAGMGQELRAHSHGLGALHGAHQGDAREPAASRRKPKARPAEGSAAAGA